MEKMRLCFSKQQAAAYISHLDLMRTFQRAFLRAGIDVGHTEGFNPHAYVSIALPLPVGHESVCELLDFGLEEGAELSGMAERLTAVMPAGIKVNCVYRPQRPFKEIFYVDNVIKFIYDGGVPSGAEGKLTALFGSAELSIMKKAKKGGMKELNIIPLIKRINFFVEDDNTLLLRAILQAQEPYLNPVYVTAAVEKYLPELLPDSATYRRAAPWDRDLAEFY